VCVGSCTFFHWRHTYILVAWLARRYLLGLGVAVLLHATQSSAPYAGASARVAVLPKTMDWTHRELDG
jgi:hypothetical protein